MKRCSSNSPMGPTLVDLSYGLLEPAAEAAARAHLSGCEACRADLESLSALTGALVPEEAFPREDEVNWEAFARTTVRRATARRPGLAESIAGWLQPIIASPARAAWAAAAVGLVAITGGLIVMQQGGGPDPAQPAVAALEGVRMPEANIDNLTINLARQNTAQYLRETRTVLVTLLDVGINCNEEGKVDISAERIKAMELLRRQRLVANELKRLPLARAQEVCHDLERLLLEVAALGDCTKDAEIQTLRDVVEKRQILVRMELLTQELARRSTHV